MQDEIFHAIVYLEELWQFIGMMILIAGYSIIYRNFLIRKLNRTWNEQDLKKYIYYSRCLALFAGIVYSLDSFPSPVLYALGILYIVVLYPFLVSRALKTRSLDLPIDKQLTPIASKTFKKKYPTAELFLTQEEMESQAEKMYIRHEIKGRQSALVFVIIFGLLFSFPYGLL